MSDGMCGYVTLKDDETGFAETVRWSVSSEITSQEAAAEEAEVRLLKARRLFNKEENCW